jgi:nitrate/nitrite transporter NarK
MYQSIAFTFMSFVMSFVFTVPHRVMEQKVVGTAFGIINFGGQAAGIFSPLIMGALIASTGSYKAAFIFLTICCLIAAVVACFLPLAKKSQTATDYSTVKTAN